MSDTIKFTPSPAFDRAAQALDIGVESFWFNQYPAEQARKASVREAERELAQYWNGYWEARHKPGAVRTGSAEGWDLLLANCIDRVAPRISGPKLR